jgi:hypothetical protein
MTASSPEHPHLTLPRLRLLLVLSIVAVAASSVVLIVSAPAHAAAATYYVGSTGNDKAAGTSPETAWRTIVGVNAKRLGPGDRVLFEAGSSFVGPLELQPGESGSGDAPIVFGSYGAGKATIDGRNGTAVLVYNAGGITISDLAIVGAGAATNTGSGINFFNDLPGDTKLQFVQIGDVVVRGFGEYGIVIGGWNGSSGFEHVTVTSAVVRNNGRAGLITYGPPFQPDAPAYANRDVAVSYVKAYNNLGDPDDLVHNSGSGIVLGSVRNGLVARSVAHDNGGLCRANECGVGIWTYDSSGITIQFNLSNNNQTGGKTDGDGFDLDQNTSDSIVQYNYSYDNDGAGYLLFSAPPNVGHSGNTIRYNVSQNDGRKNGFGAISGGGNIYDDAVYNNTVYHSAARSGRPPGALFSSAGGGVTVRNNIFYLADGLSMVSAPKLGTKLLDFQQNDYFSPSSPFEVHWGSAVYTSLSNWRTATGQEMFGQAPTGLVVDPQLVAAGGGASLRNPNRLGDLTAYKLQPDTPLLGLGLDLAALFGVDTGGRDYFGVPVPSGNGPEIGASEVSR